MYKFFLFCTVIYCFSTPLEAQEKYQLNFLLGPSYENIGSRQAGIDMPFQYKYSYNFGGEIKYYLLPNFSTNFGVQYNNKGFTSDFNYVVNSDTFPSSITVHASYLSIPFEFCWNYTPAFRTEYFFSAGINYGILINQSFVGKRVPAELGRPDNSLYEGVTNDRTNITWFDKNYVGIQGGVGFSRYIKSRMVLTFHPTFSFQIDGLINPEGPVKTVASTSSGLPTTYSPKLTSFLLLFKIGYYFSDQIENTKKEL